jgi:hypothetical protein
MPNPPYGAVFTYHLRETPADGATLVLTITDDSGEQVRRLALPGEAGVQRVAWDLRHDPPPPPEEGSGPARSRRPRQGSPVGAGRFTAALGILSGEEVTILGEPQTFLVVPLER